MENKLTVKRTFFISEEEAKTLKELRKDPYITHRFPCYELENGEVMYPKYGYPAGGEVWYQDNQPPL